MQQVRKLARIRIRSTVVHTRKGAGRQAADFLGALMLATASAMLSP